VVACVLWHKRAIAGLDSPRTGYSNSIVPNPIDLLSQRLSKWESDLRSSYSENVDVARSDAQKAGHAAEGIWQTVDEQILPPAYRVLNRKYMETEVERNLLPGLCPEASSVLADVMRKNR
jgi:hypothetical protein